MDSQFSKLLLRENISPLKKNITINSMKNPQNHFRNNKKRSVNLQNLSQSEKNRFYFQSYIKNYGISQIDNSHWGNRFPKTPKNFLSKKGKKFSLLYKRAKTLQTSKNSINESYEKSDIFTACKIDMDLININISLVASYFKATYQDQASIKKFNDKYKNIEGYEEILLLMQEFKDFNIFDYLNVYSTNTLFLSKEQKEERQKNISKRNNIILSLLIEHENLKEKEEKGLINFGFDKKVFSRNEYLFPLLKNFKMIISKMESDKISFEVELIILCLLDYYEYANFLFHFHMNYFKNFLTKIGIKDYDLNKFIKIISNQEFESLEEEEIIIFRKALNSMAERDLYLGIDRIISNENLYRLANEGRLWKNIGINMESYDVYQLWEKYKSKIISGNYNFISTKTIEKEYKSQIKEMEEELNKYEKNPLLKEEKQTEFNKLIYDLDNLKSDIALPFVYDLENLLLIFFKYLLKDTVIFFLDNMKDLDEKIFEMCLAFDEDICIYIMDRCLNNSNAKASYVHISVYKKFFKLTRMLLNYKICKNELVVFHNYIVPHNRLNKKNKIKDNYFYQEGKEGVLHFLNEKDANNNLGETFLSMRNSIRNNIKSTISPENAKLSRTIIAPSDKVSEFFKKIFPRKKIKKRKSFQTPNIKVIKNTDKKLLKIPTLKNKIKFKSDIQTQYKPKMNSSDTSNSNLQSSNCTLILGKNKKKDSFFSILNHPSVKEKINSNQLSHGLIKENSNHFSGFRMNKNNNIKLEEEYSPIRGKSHFIGNRFSKFSKANGINKEKSKNNFNIKSIKNLTLRPKDWQVNMSLEDDDINKRKKSFDKDNKDIIKNMRKKLNDLSNLNINKLNNTNNKHDDDNNISIIDEGDSPILKIIYNTDGEDNDGSQLVIRNKSNLGLNKSLIGRKSKVLSKNEVQEVSKDNNNISNFFKSEKIVINNKQDDLFLNENEKRDIYKKQTKKINKASTKIESPYYDPMFHNILNGNIKLNIQLILIENLRFGCYLFDSISLLGLMPLHEFSLEMFEKICQSLNSYNTNEDSIIACLSPLLSIALSAELLVKIGNKSKKIKYKSDSVCKSLLLLAYSIQTAIKNEDTLNFYLRIQTDIIGRSALEIYAENHFYDMLEDPNVGMIIGKLWYGSEHEHKLTTFLRMTRILRANSYELYEHLIRKDYLPKNSRFTFQFCQYVYNCSERNFYESISIMAITLMYQVVVYLYVTFTKENEMHPKSHYYYDVQMFTNILMLLSLFNDFFVVLFFRLTGRVGARFNMMHVFVNFFLFIFLIFNIFDIPELICPVEKDPDFNILLDGIVYSVILLMSWMKVLLLLRITKLYGSFISIMLNIFWHVVNFFIIFICITLLFAQCFCLFFRESNDNYILIYDSFLTLFNTAWGQVEFNFVDLDVFGEVCLILFTTLSNIMLFNLIVGIVNNLFDQYHEKAEAESRAKLVLAHERKRWDKNYGLLILFPSPFNIFSIIFYPILIFSGEKKAKLNLLFSKFCYFFVALLIFFYLILLGILTYFIALFKSLFHSTIETIKSTNKNISKNKCKIIALSFLTRPFELIIYFFEDMISFWQVVFEEPIIDQEKKKREITTFRRYVITLRKILTDFKYKEHQTKLSVKKIRKKFQEFKKKNTMHLTREETTPPIDNNAHFLEEEKNWQKMINHTLFLQLNGQKKKKGQEYNESVSLTDGLSDNKSIRIYSYKNKVRKIHKKENRYKKSENNISYNKGSRANININVINNNNNNINVITSENEDSRNIVNTSKDNTMILQKRLTSIDTAKMYMSLHLIKNLWKIIDKFADPEGVIDIDKTLNLLPDRAVYDNDFILNLNNFNIRTIMRGIRKYYFKLELENSLFSFNKGTLMIYKLMTKLAMINLNLPENVLQNLKTEYNNLNEMSKFAKTPEAFQKYEEKDIMSDYDDEGKYAENNFYDYDKKADNGSIIDTNRNIDDSEEEVEGDGEGEGDRERESLRNKSLASLEEI